MEIALYIAIIIALIALVVLVFFVINTLKVTKETLNEVSTTLQGLESQLDSVTSETTQLISKTNRLAEDFEQKSQKMNGLFDGAKGIGDTISEFDRSLKQLTDSIQRASKEDQAKANEAVKWGTSVLDYFIKRKNTKH